VIPRAQEELLHNVFAFARREVRDVMVPAADVAWLDTGWTVDAALDRIVGRPHSRYPVGEGSLDRLVGVVHAHPAPIVPETKDLGALLRERRQHLAVVGRRVRRHRRHRHPRGHPRGALGRSRTSSTSPTTP
jgi:putative hemolysin